jgi:probable F420-dependent oxidoreductase
MALPDHRELVQQLEGWGYTDLWTAEGGQVDGLIPVATAAVWSPRLRLGTGVLSAFTRGPAVLATSAATMAELAPGRFTLGIGSSSDVIVAGHNGIAFDRPFSRVRDVVRFLKLAHDGERITERFDTFQIDGYRLGRRVEPRPTIVVAALRERMLRLAGDEADGVMLNWVSPDDIRDMAAIVRKGNPEAEVVDRIMVCPSPDREVVSRLVKPIAAVYTAVGVYREFHRWRGREELLAESWAAFDAGDRGRAAAAIPDEVVDAVCVHGTPAQCRERLRDYVEAGVTTPVIALLSPSGDVRGDVLALAPTG